MKKIITVSFALLLAAVCVLLCGCSQFDRMGKSGEKYEYSAESITEEIKKIDIDWQAGNVTFSVGEESGISVCERTEKRVGDEYAMNCYTENGTLIIKYLKSGIPVGIGLDKDLEVSIPALLEFDTVTVNTASADVKIEKLAAGEVNIMTSSGKIDTSISGNDNVYMTTSSGDIFSSLDGSGVCVFDTSSGKINITALGEYESVDADSSSGEISLDFEKCGKVSVETSSGAQNMKFGTAPSVLFSDGSSGDVSLTLPKNSGFTLDMDSSSGKTEILIPSIMTDGKYICGDGSGDYRVSTASGSLTVSPLD